jgi:hypothetical protein
VLLCNHFIFSNLRHKQLFPKDVELLSELSQDRALRPQRGGVCAAEREGSQVAAKVVRSSG